MANGNDIQITPRADAAAPQAPTPSPSPEAQVPAEGGSQGSLPDELLQQPVMQALMAGSPPAVSANIEAAQQTEFGQAVAQYGQQMQRAGFGFYRAKSGDLGVVFNQLFLPPEELLKADEAGTLTELAPPLEQVEQAMLTGDPNANPVLNAQTPGAPPVAQPGGGAAPVAGPPRPTPSRVTTQRKQNLEAGSPTSGPRPGAGRVLNAIMKPVV
jgi:hypothetical protein